MTINEAFELLNISSVASEEEIVSAYKKLYSDYQIRLNNAPTPHLKTLYQNNIKKLDEAFHLLMPEGAYGINVDLPVDSPFLIQNTGQSQAVNIVQNNTKKGSDETKVADLKEKNNKFIIPLLGFIAVLALSVTVFFYIQYSEMNTKLKRISEDSEKNNIIAGQLPKNGKLKIVNKLGEDIVVAFVSVSYFDEDNVLKSFESRSAEPRPSFINRLEADKTLEFNYAVGQNMIWDGSVVYYSIVVIMPERQFPRNFEVYSGLWQKTQTEGKIIFAPSR